jgi:hypothetical protein
VRDAGRDRFRGGEVLGALGTEVVLRRPQAGPVGSGLDAAGLDRDRCGEPVGGGPVEQLPDDPLGFLVGPLAEVVVADAAQIA